MYLEHFGLNEPPFRITPHTDFFFDGANRGATLDALIYAVTHDEGIVKVSGEVGSGKTMLCRVLMERLPETVTIIYLANPLLSRDDILYTIADELRLDVPENARSSAVLRALQDRLIKSFSEGRQVVVLIDEAHAMPVETLEEIRLLSNLETNRSKLLQLVLFGQPELNDILARPDMRQLKERITHNFGLEPLVRDDINHYLDFRMRAAGYRGPSVFSPTALKMIEQNSLGLTRRINILADKALLAAFSLGSHQIGTKEIQAAVRDCEFSKATYGSKTAQKTQTVRIAASLAVCVLAGIVWLMTMPRNDNGAPATAAGEPPAPTNTIGTASAAVTAPPVGALPAAASTPSPSLAAGTKPAIASPPSPPAKYVVGPLTLERLEAGRTWLGQLPDDRWFIQVYATNADQHGEIETLLNRLSSSKTEMGNIHVYYSELSGKPRYGVMYGEYSTSEAASAAIRELPRLLRAGNPYPRQVVRLR
ncbi:MAG: AAA family ATPase [Sulfuritalea sp.]|jgi:type II secretory pathway predicted ATPase ExeA|nr:AAA family ATPase [Sulfuritalea sp.]